MMRILRDLIYNWRTDLSDLEEQISEYEEILDRKDEQIYNLSEQVRFLEEQNARLEELNARRETEAATLNAELDKTRKSGARAKNEATKLKKKIDNTPKPPWAIVKKNKGGKWYWVAETSDHHVVAIGTGKFTKKEDADADAAASGLQVSG